MENFRRNRPEARIIPINTLKPYAEKLRVHNREQALKLQKLIRKFGQVVPVIVDHAKCIIDGHLVWQTLRDLGHDEITVVEVSGRCEAEVRALRLALNRLPQDAAWDNEKLRFELQALLDLSFDLELTAFSAVEIDYILEVSEASGEPEVPAIQPVPVSQQGDIWLLGDHRIGCGNSLDPQFVATLLGGETPAMIFEDPPYNVRIDGHVSGNGATQHREFAMASGEMSEAEFTGFLAKSLGIAKSIAKPGSVAFVCMDWRHLGELLAASRQADLEVLNLCVWTKPTPGLGTFYRSQHELVAVLRAGNAEIRNNMALNGKRRNRSNVWAYRGMNSFGDGRDELVKMHPTVKPVALIADAIRDVSLRGDTVFDGFLGSGSTLMAAEETGRTCCGIEIDPIYVDVAIRRWQQATGKDAILSGSSQTFLEVSERRATAMMEATHG